MVILRRTGKAMLRATCGVKLIENMSSQEHELARFGRDFGWTNQSK